MIIDYLGPLVKGIEATKDSVNCSFAQIGGEMIEDLGDENTVIGGQLGFPNKIGRGSSTKSAVQGCKFTNLGRIHVSENRSDAALR